MGIKHLSLIFALSSVVLSCTDVTTDSAIAPRNITVSVDYVRVSPVDLRSSNVALVRWSYGFNTGVASLIAREPDGNDFNTAASIRTETKITMHVEDWRKVPSPPVTSYYVRKRLLISDHELIFEGSEFGSVEFIYHNDGSIEITNPAQMDSHITRGARRNP